MRDAPAPLSSIDAARDTGNALRRISEDRVVSAASSLRGHWAGGLSAARFFSGISRISVTPNWYGLSSEQLGGDAAVVLSGPLLDLGNDAAPLQILALGRRQREVFV